MIWTLPSCSHACRLWPLSLQSNLYACMVYRPSVRSRWLDIGQVLFFLRVYGSRQSRGTRPISMGSHLDRTNLVKKGFIIWFLGNFFLRDAVDIPEWQDVWVIDQVWSQDYKLTKKEQGQYPAILIKQTWSKKDLLWYGFRGNFACRIQRVVLRGRLHLARLGSQSQRMILVILPAHRATHTISMGYWPSVGSR